MIDERAEIVANVWKLLVTIGERVDTGQTLAVLESMKMEIPVYASAAGHVSDVFAAEGQIVQEGDALVRIDPHG